jgi:hypothetical protein
VVVNFAVGHVTVHGSDLVRIINDYMEAVGQTENVVDIAKTMLLFSGDTPQGDAHILLRIRRANLEAIVIPPSDLDKIPPRGFLTPVELSITGEPTVYRLGIPDFEKPECLEVIDIMREAGVADEVDELFIGGREPDFGHISEDQTPDAIAAQVEAADPDPPEAA